MIAFVASMPSFAGCAHRTALPAAAATTTALRPSIATGRWDGLYKIKITEGDGAGDTRIERQAWQLQQDGGIITGFCVVELTMISGDGRPYQCSQAPRFSTLMRFELRGRARDGAVDLEEIGDVKSLGPCRPAAREHERYQASVDGDVLTMTGAGRRQRLYRRPPTSAGAVDEDLANIVFNTPASAPLETALASTPGTRDDIGGFWVWETRGTLPNGDEKQEREEWHLTQEGTSVSGFYDRHTRQVSMDGAAYRCSGALEFRVTTRYRVSGEVRGDRIVLTEDSFEVLDPSPCDEGRRRLDTYRGYTSASELRLRWGAGQQVLHRARPDVPTQRF